MKISIGSDHAGFSYKGEIVEMLVKAGHAVVDHGTYSEESVDYPDFVHPVAFDIENGKTDMGIVICGSGNGVNMTANKHQGIRSALCWEPEIARLARQHNNANVIALPARFIDIETAKECVRAFVSESFEGGRHARRVDKITL